ncbi:MAG: type III-B CRISPR module RAMP protein Cmr1 [Verrucomicrobiia bacterium]
MQWQRDIEIITPLFNRGAYQDTPEIRVPSIRGMVRWWFRALGGSADDEKEVFGGMKRFGRRFAHEVRASKLVFRVTHLEARIAPDPGIPILPHKQGGQASPQAAFQPGARFHLEVFSRLDPLPPQLQRKVENALEAWLLLGALGMRANRGGGNVWPADNTAPNTPAELRQRLVEHGCNWQVMIAGQEVGHTVEELRKAATDTRNGMPLIFGEAFPNRRTSKVKFKIVRFGEKLRLLIAAPDTESLRQAKEALKGKLSKPETWQPI